MKLSDLTDPPDTEIQFPRGLKEHFSAYTLPQIRRRVLVSLGSNFLPVPMVQEDSGSDGFYTIDHEKIVFPHPLKTLDIVAVIDIRGDERWYYSHDVGWART